MKKNTYKFIALLIIQISCISSYAEENLGVVSQVTEGAWKIHADKAVRSSLNKGSEVKLGERIQTQRDGSVRIQLDDTGKNMVEINGDFSLREDGKKSEVFLNQGRAVAVLDKMKPGSEFSIVTPNAVAAVRGTHFEVLTSGELTKLLVSQGIVEMRSRHEASSLRQTAIRVKAGEKSEVAASSSIPKKAERMSSSEIDRLQKKVQRVIQNQRASAEASGSSRSVSSGEASVGYSERANAEEGPVRGKNRIAL